jgi:hypothetical protein
MPPGVPTTPPLSTPSRKKPKVPPGS